MLFYHASNSPILAHNEKTLRVGIFARTNVEGILPINIYFTSIMDFYSYLLFSTIITHNALRTKKKKKKKKKKNFVFGIPSFFILVSHIFSIILFYLCKAYHFQNHWRITNKIHHTHYLGFMQSKHTPQNFW